MGDLFNKLVNSLRAFALILEQVSTSPIVLKTGPIAATALMTRLAISILELTIK